jgi:hypothetical protein
MKIMVHIDSGANIKSKNVKYMNIDKEEWDNMDEDERDELVKEFIWCDMGASWGYEEVDE